MSEYTPGPWVNTGGTIESNLGWHIASAVNTAGGNSIVNANRIVACVNACEGMGDPEAEIKTIRAEALKDAADRAIRWVHGFGVELLCYDDHGNDLDGDIGLRAAILAGEVKE
jgi:hypothetical protein